jgi:hypothetical protein
LFEGGHLHNYYWRGQTEWYSAKEYTLPMRVKSLLLAKCFVWAEGTAVYFLIPVLSSATELIQNSSSQEDNMNITISVQPGQGERFLMALCS